jgi:ribonuclease P protein component
VTGSAQGQRFRPEDRIRRKADFDRAYASGRRVSSKSFTLILRDAQLDRARLGLTVPKRVGNAVVRNRVRRRLREAFRRNRDCVPAALDIVIQVRPRAARLSYAALEEELLQALRRHNPEGRTREE